MLDSEIASTIEPVRPKDDFLVFGSPQIGEEEIESVVESLRSGWIGSGAKVGQFEDDFRAYKKSTYVAAVSSCTAALHLSLLSLKLNPGDEVITTPMTFCATVNAIIHAGLTPVLADVDPRTTNIDPREIMRRITPRTRAILPVHFAGRPCQMDDILEIAKTNNLKIVEDCAHAVETEYHGRAAGTMGDFGCFSFYVTKNVVTAEGGMVVAQSENDAASIKTLALHGMDKDAWRRFSDSGYKHYDVVSSGFKYNMTDLQAAIGIPQLQRVESNWKRRLAIWQRYNDAFAGLPIELPASPEPNTKHGLHLYTLLIREDEAQISRDEFLAAMTRNNIGVGVHYRAIPELHYYQERFGWKPDDWPVSRDIGRRTVSIPLSPKLTEKDVEDVITAVKAVLGAKRV